MNLKRWFGKKRYENREQMREDVNRLKETVDKDREQVTGEETSTDAKPLSGVRDAETGETPVHPA